MISTRVLLRRGFTGACVAWAGALPAATYAAASPRAGAPVYLFAVLIYAIGSVVCHQLPERSFHLWGRQLPVCARCTGIYAGAALALVVFRAARRAGQTRAPGSETSSTVIAAVAALPTAATLIFEWTTGVTPSNGIRAAAGVVLGAAVAGLVARELATGPQQRA